MTRKNIEKCENHVITAESVVIIATLTQGNIYRAINLIVNADEERVTEVKILS